MNSRVGLVSQRLSAVTCEIMVTQRPNEKADHIHGFVTK